MPNILFTLTISSFAYFFFKIGTWQLTILCGVILVSYFVFSMQKNQKGEKSFDIKKIFKQNGLTLAWLSVLTGIGAFMHFFMLGYQIIFLIFMGINIILRLLSIIFKYKDGEKLFQFTYYLSLLIRLTILFLNLELLSFFPIFLSTIIFHLGWFGFLNFVVGYYTKIDKYYFSSLYVLVQIVIAIGIITFGFYLNKILLFVILCQVYFLVIFYLNYLTFDVIKEYNKETKKITAEDILQGARVLEYRKKVKKIREKVVVLYYKILGKLNYPVLQIVSFLNILLMLLVITLFTVNISNGLNSGFYQALYWISVLVFIASFLFIKKTPMKLLNIHRAFIFMVINFVVYINFFYFFGKDQITNIVSVGILRNFINAITISQSKYIFQKGFFIHQDYFFWVIANILSLVLNVVLLIYSSLPGEIIFGAVTLYLGTFGFLTYYNINYIYEIKNQ